MTLSIEVCLLLAVGIWIDLRSVFGIEFLDPELPLLTVVEALWDRVAQFVE